MLGSIIRTLFGKGGSPQFQSYYADLLDHVGVGTPTADEARKDYRAMLNSQTGFVANW